ncbi:NAD(P)H-binding protein [Neisseria perflava]|uniref:NAD(P)H-binding protein n=1 Tax=Neisseria perflava TaxID=33053 RepID=UPI0020A11044|nr:NAD(P)H-binding protein [Neisseria perflava]MCP1660713.1 uncharacterized protein YbjT (DUF2867 family) [Neisseria perflava]MCP1772959.1 uncharacterized protein YbjT (DUF2867 family) [Neisseria perflava]
MKALLIGATGATGREVLARLLADDDYERVDIFVRKPVTAVHDKLHVHVVDFSRPNSFADKVRGDVLFSCLGTTLKAAGSQAAQWAVDYDMQLAFAQMAKANGVDTLVLVSSGYASSTAKAFYPRMKGCLEQAVAALNFANLLILRPPLLVRQGSDRFGEVLGVKILNGLNKLGLLKNMRPLPTDVLAKVMVAAAKTVRGTQIWEAQEIWQAAGSSKAI